MFGVLVLLPPALWYVHAYRLFVQYHNTFGIIASGYLKFGDVDLLTDPRFYARTFIRLVLLQTTPLGFLLVAIGSARRVDRAVQYLFHVWLGGRVDLLRRRGGGREYRALSICAPNHSSMCGARRERPRRAGSELESRQWTLGTLSGRTVAFMLVGLLAANTVAANYLNQARGMNFRQASVLRMKTGKALARLTAPGDLIVVVDADMDDRTPETQHDAAGGVLFQRPARVVPFDVVADP